MNIISLYPNEKRDADFAVTKKVLQILDARGVTALLPAFLKEKLSAVAKNALFVSEEELFARGACLITLGGDGTILSVARRAAHAGIPVCGINLGRVGFMASLEKRQIEKINDLIDGNFTLSSRMMLSCEVAGKSLVALNEICIAPEKGFHMANMTLYQNRKRFCDFRADGVIFNTPTGSTGYAFSAGGAVIDDRMDCIGVKTVSSYLLRDAHHMIFRPETVFTVKNCRCDGETVTVCADGRDKIALGDGDTIRIARAPFRLPMVTFQQKTNLELFFHKF